MQIQAYIGEIQKTHSPPFYRFANIRKANSFVRQFIDLLTRHLTQSAKTAKDITGADRSYNPYANTFAVNASVDVTNLGIVIGSDDTPVAIDQYSLQSQLTTNIAHGAVAFSGPTLSGDTCYVDIIRTFTNNTGALVTIKEVGLYCYSYGTSYVYMIDRTLYTLEIPDTEAKTLAYRIAISV